MRRLITFLAALFILAPAFSAAAAQEGIPLLGSVEFNNAEIEGEFSPEINEYTVTLNDSSLTPTLKSYSIEGEAELFFTYKLDEAKHQSGILITLSFDSGSTEYSFDYANPGYDSKSENNYLKEISCSYCELSPEISRSDEEYRLYIPSDLTELNIRAVTEDINASCDLPKSITLASGQEPEFTLTVTAGNGQTRAYSLKITRLDKTLAEVKEEMSREGFTSLITGERFYRKPLFITVFAACISGIMFFAILLKVLKRLSVKAQDPDETDFFEA